jgi:hypothetical protein
VHHYRTEFNVKPATNAGGIDYTQITFKFAGLLSPEEREDARRLRDASRAQFSVEEVDKDPSYYAADEDGNGHTVDGEATRQEDDSLPPF